MNNLVDEQPDRMFMWSHEPHDKFVVYRSHDKKPMFELVDMPSAEALAHLLSDFFDRATFGSVVVSGFDAVVAATDKLLHKLERLESSHGTSLHNDHNWTVNVGDLKELRTAVEVMKSVFALKQVDTEPPA